MYKVEFTARAEADLGKLDKQIAQRVLKKLHWLAENFDNVTPEALTAHWQGVYKLRIGDYRVLYTFNKGSQEILVHFVRHRREVYQYGES